MTSPCQEDCHWFKVFCECTEKSLTGLKSTQYLDGGYVQMLIPDKHLPLWYTLYKVEKVEERYFWQIDVLRGWNINQVPDKLHTLQGSPTEIMLDGVHNQTKNTLGSKLSCKAEQSKLSASKNKHNLLLCFLWPHFQQCITSDQAKQFSPDWYVCAVLYAHFIILTHAFQPDCLPHPFSWGFEKSLLTWQ
jgi:hypothetical protein